MPSILLIFPLLQDQHHKLEDDAQVKKRGANRAFFAPISIATVASLTPADFDVDCWDENMLGMIDESTPFTKKYDFVGTTGFASQIGRVTDIAKLFRGRGIPVGVGGPA